MEMKIVEVTVIPIEKINTFILLWKELIREVSTKFTEGGGEVEGYTWETAADKKSENGTIVKDETEKVFFKNTYSRKNIPLIINKTVEGNMSEKRKEFAFSITLKDANGAAYELSDEEIKDVGFSTKGEDQKEYIHLR